jgi:glycosyltransferase involved in cell wall biosynthesis
MKGSGSLRGIERLTNAMLFVLPSDLEGLSLALLDAMGAGLCVLTSDVPENREAVEQAGFTFGGVASPPWRTACNF